MREVDGLWVWTDRASHCLMLGNAAAARLVKETPAPLPVEHDPRDAEPPDHFTPLGCYGLKDGPVVALRLALDAGPKRMTGPITALLAGLQTERPADIQIDYATGPEGRRLWRDGRLTQKGALDGDGAERGFSLIFELLIALLDHQPLATVLHGGGLIWRGKKVLFSGVSGAGKSTLMALLAARGARYLGDDSVALLYPDCSIFPLPLAPTIKEGAWDVVMPHFPGLAQAPVHLKGDLPFRSLTDAPRVTSGPVGPPDLLVLPRYAPDKTPKVVRLSPIEVLLELSRAGMWLSPDHTDLLIDLAHNCTAIALRHDGRIEQVEKMMAQALDGDLPQVNPENP